MTSKERVQIALDHQEPDRVPVSALFVPELQEQLGAYLGIQAELGENSVALANDLLSEIGIRLGNDLVKVQAGMESMFYVPDEQETYTTDWGVTLKKVENHTGSYTDIVKWPLQGDDSLLDSYEIPSPHRPEIYEEPKRIFEKYADYWKVGSVQISILEAGAHLRGLEDLLCDMKLNRDYAHRLFDKVMQFPLEAGKKFIEMGADMIWTGDDVATQISMMISLDTWREFLKPRYAYLFQEYRKINPNIKIAYHSDGNCEDILDDMIEIGLDVLNPIQPLSMNPDHIKKRYGKRLSLFGAVDIQQTMPFGTLEDVEAEVKHLCEVCGKGGGFILSPSHYLQTDVSIEKILKYYEAAQKYGTYHK